jgi:hypothetical protein
MDKSELCQYCARRHLTLTRMWILECQHNSQLCHTHSRQSISVSSERTQADIPAKQIGITCLGKHTASKPWIDIYVAPLLAKVRSATRCNKNLKILKYHCLGLMFQIFEWGGRSDSESARYDPVRFAGRRANGTMPMREKAREEVSIWTKARIFVSYILYKLISLCCRLLIA